MTLFFPGATWRPQPGQESRPPRRKGRGVGFHVAVYLGPSIWDINRRTGNDAHLYVRLDGGVEQNVDLDLQAWAGATGNGSMIWVETEGGMGTSAQVNAELWTPQQAETLAQIAAWANRTEGTPLQVMPDSRPTSRGIGTHRLGIQHSRGVGAVAGWLVAGGEKWSSVRGKECPGNAKIGQLPGIVARSRQIVLADRATSTTSTATSEEDDMPQAVTAQIPTTHEAASFMFPPAGGPVTPGGPSVPSGAAKWGDGWLTLGADRGAQDGGDVHGRIMIHNGVSGWRPAFGKDEHATLPLGKPITIPLIHGDHWVVFSETTGPIGACVEYAKA